jgi:catechol 2,3-dioxygenase-like lactoylglutathione lyase family enzyme
MRGRFIYDRPHRRHRQRSGKKQSFLLSGVWRDGNSLLKELPASVTGRADVVGYGAKETTTEGVSPEFWLSQGRPGNVPVHVAFRVDNRALVDAFYQAALTAGGRDNGAPGLRSQYHPNYYGAFVLDPDGNNIEAVCRTPA